MYHKPSPQDQHQTPDLFRSRLDNIIDLSHPLVKLGNQIQWQSLSQAWGALPVPATTGGNPALPVRLIASLFYLKHTYNLSDEALCARWVENPYWQYFSGEVYFQNKLPCDPTGLTHYRTRLGEAGIEELLALTIDSAKRMQVVSPSDLHTIIIDSTVQDKAIAHPTDSRLLEVSRHHLVKFAKKHGILLRRSFAKEARTLKVMAGRYAHAKQFKRMKRTIKRQHTITGQILRNIERRLTNHLLSESAINAWTELSSRIKRLLKQQRRSKNKLYALHAPEVECISKGKARCPYEFGVKVGIAVTAKQGLVVGARSFSGNPYDGSTLYSQCEQVEILTEEPIKTIIVDLGYRGRDDEIAPIKVIHRGKSKSLSKADKVLLKRRQSIEPIIGHMKADGRLGRCYLKGSAGDAINAILCGAGYNIRLLLRWIALFWLYYWSVMQGQRQPQLT